MRHTITTTRKNKLHLIGLDDHGAIILREKVPRGRIGARLANVPPCLIGIEAGMATHYLARELIAPATKDQVAAEPATTVMKSRRLVSFPQAWGRYPITSIAAVVQHSK